MMGKCFGFLALFAAMLFIVVSSQGGDDQQPPPAGSPPPAGLPPLFGPPPFWRGGRLRFGLRPPPFGLFGGFRGQHRHGPPPNISECFHQFSVICCYWRWSDKTLSLWSNQQSKDLKRHFSFRFRYLLEYICNHHKASWCF